MVYWVQKRCISCYWSWACCQIFLCLERHTIEANESIQRRIDPFASFACQTADNCKSKTVKLKMIGSSYFELRKTKWQTNIKQRVKLFTYISRQLPHNEANCKTQQQLLHSSKSEVNIHKSREVKNTNLSLNQNWNMPTPQLKMKILKFFSTTK